MKKSFGVALICMLLTQVGLIFAGIQWQAKIVTSRADKEEAIISYVYAQDSNVREEYVEASGENVLMEKGHYWLYKGSENTVYIVNPDEKTYMALSIDSLAQLTGGLQQIMKMTISNAKVEVNKLDPETVGGYSCNHLKINTAYDMEMKILFIKTKSHIEQSKEIWGTTAIPISELANSFRTKSFKVGIVELDSLLGVEMAAYKDFGFTVKSVTIEKTTSGNKTETSTTEMTVSDVVTKNLSSDLFTIPADYKKVEFKLGGGEE